MPNKSQNGNNFGTKQNAWFLLLGGIAMGLAPAPWGLTFTAWIAQIPLWLWVFQHQTESNRHRFFLARLFTAMLWGGGFYGVALFWITGVHPLTWLGVPWGASLAIATFCWLAITAWGVTLVFCWLSALGWWQATTAKAGVQAGVKQSLLLLWGVASWCALETIWSHSILWWSPLAYSQSPGQLNFLQWGSIGGPALLTAVIVLVNGLLALAWLNRNRAWSYGVTALLIWCLTQTGGAWLAQRPLADNATTRIKVGIIQGNIPNQIKFNSEGWRQAIAGYTEGYEQLAARGVDAVLTPEGALPYLWETVVGQSSFYQAVLRIGVPVWLGAYAGQGEGYSNSLFSIDGQGQLQGRYDKVKLVPLGEYIPLRSLLGNLIQRLSPLKAQLVPGDRPRILSTPFGPAAVMICYESAFPHLLRPQLQQGAEFILSVANNAHYSDTMASQHHALDVMRAIEGDRWLARATNTGLSAIINPRGQTLWLSAMNQYQVQAGVIHRRRGLTFYSRWGDWIVVFLLASAALAWGWLAQTPTQL